MTDDVEHGRGEMASKRTPGCKCGVVGVRDEEFDAYYCPVSGVWLESPCIETDNDDCDICPGRPEKRAVT